MSELVDYEDFEYAVKSNPKGQPRKMYCLAAVDAAILNYDGMKKAIQVRRIDVSSGKRRGAPKNMSW